MEFVTKDLVRLSEETEKAEMVKRLLTTMTSIDETRAEAKSKAKEYKGIISELEFKEFILRGDLERGTITLPIEVHQVANLETGYMEYWDRNGSIVEAFSKDLLTGEQIEAEKARRATATKAESQITIFPHEKPDLAEREWSVGDLGYHSETDQVFLVLAVQGGRTGVAITEQGQLLYLDLWTIQNAKYSGGMMYQYTTSRAAEEDFKADWFSPWFVRGRQEVVPTPNAPESETDVVVDSPEKQTD